MSTSGVDSMFYSGVTDLADQVDQALVAIKTGSEDRSAVDVLSRRLADLDTEDLEVVALRLLLTLADDEHHGLEYWTELGRQLAQQPSSTAVPALEALARALENEQSQLEARLRRIG